MRLNKEFALRKVVDTWVVLPLGDTSVDFNGMLKLNESGAMLWKVLENCSDCEELVSALVAEYNVSRDEAIRDIDCFVKKLADFGCLEM